MIENIKKILQSDDCFATTALLCFIRVAGTEGLEWLPGTIRHEMDLVFGGISESTFNRLMAGIQILTSDDFYILLKRFIDYTNILNHGHLDDFVADIGEICWALTEAKIIEDPGPIENPLQIFSSDVASYIEVAFNESGLLVPPRILKEYGFKAFSKTQEAMSSFTDTPELYQPLYVAATYHTTLLETALQQKKEALKRQVALCGFDIKID